MNQDAHLKPDLKAHLKSDSQSDSKRDSTKEPTKDAANDLTFNRRDFLKKTTALSASGAVVGGLSGVLAKADAGADGHVAESTKRGTYSLPDRFEPDLADMKLRVGVIGCGWYGLCDVSRMMQVAPVDVVAVCDVYCQKMFD